MIDCVPGVPSLSVKQYVYSRTLAQPPYITKPADLKQSKGQSKYLRFLSLFHRLAPSAPNRLIDPPKHINLVIRGPYTGRACTVLEKARAHIPTTPFFRPARFPHLNVPPHSERLAPSPQPHTAMSAVNIPQLLLALGSDAHGAAPASAACAQQQQHLRELQELGGGGARGAAGTKRKKQELRRVTSKRYRDTLGSLYADLEALVPAVFPDAKLRTKSQIIQLTGDAIRKLKRDIAEKEARYVLAAPPMRLRWVAEVAGAASGVEELAAVFMRLMVHSWGYAEMWGARWPGEGENGEIGEIGEEGKGAGVGGAGKGKEKMKGEGAREVASPTSGVSVEGEGEGTSGKGDREMEREGGTMIGASASASDGSLVEGSGSGSAGGSGSRRECATGAEKVKRVEGVEAVEGATLAEAAEVAAAKASAPDRPLLCGAGAADKASARAEAERTGRVVYALDGVVSRYDGTAAGTGEVPKGMREFAERRRGVLVREGEEGVVARAGRGRAEWELMDGGAAGFAVCCAVPLVVCGRVRGVVALFNEEYRVEMRQTLSVAVDVAAALGNSFSNRKRGPK